MTALDTIFALASGAGRGAIAVLRLSGPESGAILSRLPITDPGDRDYARLEEKHFVPSELGETVSDLLAEHFVKITNDVL